MTQYHAINTTRVFTQIHRAISVLRYFKYPFITMGGMKLKLKFSLWSAVQSFNDDYVTFPEGFSLWYDPLNSAQVPGSKNRTAVIHECRKKRIKLALVPRRIAETSSTMRYQFGTFFLRLEFGVGLTSQSWKRSFVEKPETNTRIDTIVRPDNIYRTTGKWLVICNMEYKKYFYIRSNRMAK